MIPIPPLLSAMVSPAAASSSLSASAGWRA
jgi:hypothetical protein